MTDLREEKVKWANWGVANHHLFDYLEVRPIKLTNVGPFVFDCSGFDIWTGWKAAIVDCGGDDYNGDGNSSTIFTHNKQIALGAIKAGDHVTFGPEGSTHVAIIVKPGADPMTASFGHEGAPEFVTVSELVASIKLTPLPALPVTYLELNVTPLHPGPVVKPTKHPAPEQIVKAGLVALTTPRQAQIAINHGWNLFVWNGTKFVYAVGKQAKGTPEYANRLYSKPRVK